MSTPSSMAVVLDGGLVQAVIVQDWPSIVPLPRLVVVDHDIEGADDDELTQFRIADTATEAVCHVEPISVYESFDKALSPKTVLTALGEPADQEIVDPAPLIQARKVRQEILEMDANLLRLELPPTGDDYNRLHLLAVRGLNSVLKALGDAVDFGD